MAGTVCLGCGLTTDVNGNVAADIWPSTCIETATGVDKNGLSCRVGPDGVTSKLWVAPDPHGRAFRQARNASFTLDGPIDMAPVFNTGNSGSHIYNTRNGTAYNSSENGEIVPYLSRGVNQGSIIRHNFSCARLWDFAVTNTFNCSILCSAGFKGNFLIDESFDASTWVTRDNLNIDHTGRGAAPDKVLFCDTTWNGGVLPNTTEYTDFRLQVIVFSGSVTLINPDFSATYWSGAINR